MINDRSGVPDDGEFPPVRLSALKALIGDNETAARSILRSFSTHSSGIALQLRAACMSGQHASASEAAHKLKSAARAIGAFTLAQLCAEMERAGEMGDTAALSEQLPLFNREEASVAAFLVMREEDPTPICEVNRPMRATS
jgi:HPt (histidine-containing phosphotransfer) domain-containing protein